MFLFVDTETGGLNPSTHALLSVAMLVVDEGEIINTLSFKINPFNGPSKTIDVAALAVNKLSLDDLITNGLAPALAINRMQNFLGQYKQKLIPAGYNVGFDIAFLEALFDVSAYVTRHKLDVMALVIDRHEKTTPLRSYRLAEVARHYGLGNQSHDALGDVMLTYQLWKKLGEQ